MPAKKGFLSGVIIICKRPSSAACKKLADLHINSINVRALLPVDFNATKDSFIISATSSSSNDSFPSHGTSGRLNSRSKEKLVCFPVPPFKASSPQGYQSRDCRRAAEGRDFFRLRQSRRRAVAGSISHPLLALPPWWGGMGEGREERAMRQYVLKRFILGGANTAPDLDHRVLPEPHASRGCGGIDV